MGQSLIYGKPASAAGFGADGLGFNVEFGGPSNPQGHSKQYLGSDLQSTCGLAAKVSPWCHKVALINMTGM